MLHETITHPKLREENSLYETISDAIARRPLFTVITMMAKPCRSPRWTMSCRENNARANLFIVITIEPWNNQFARVFRPINHSILVFTRCVTQWKGARISDKEECHLHGHSKASNWRHWDYTGDLWRLGRISPFDDAHCPIVYSRRSFLRQRLISMWTAFSDWYFESVSYWSHSEVHRSSTIAVLERCPPTFESSESILMCLFTVHIVLWCCHHARLSNRIVIVSVLIGIIIVGVAGKRIVGRMSIAFPI